MGAAILPGRGMQILQCEFCGWRHGEPVIDRGYKEPRRDQVPRRHEAPAPSPASLAYCFR